MSECYWVHRTKRRTPEFVKTTFTNKARIFDRPGCGRRASQQHNDTLLLLGVKGGRRVSTGMLDATRHQVFIPRRNLATENVLEEEEREGWLNIRLLINIFLL